MNKKGKGSCIAFLEGKHVYLGFGRKSPMFDLGNLFFFFNWTMPIFRKVVTKRNSQSIPTAPESQISYWDWGPRTRLPPGALRCRENRTELSRAGAGGAVENLRGAGAAWETRAGRGARGWGFKQKEKWILPGNVSETNKTIKPTLRHELKRYPKVWSQGCTMWGQQVTRCSWKWWQANRHDMATSSLWRLREEGGKSPFLQKLATTWKTVRPHHPYWRVLD